MLFVQTIRFTTLNVSFEVFLFQLDLMRNIRHSIIENTFPEFIVDFFAARYPKKEYPEWAVEALNHVGVQLNHEIGKCVTNDSKVK